jgi:serine/threonine-protein kinase
VPAGQAPRFCGECGAALGPTGDSATVAGRPVAPAVLRQRAATPTSGRFLPGAIVAGRYRMVGLIGRGGMGEVYRADDLKLGQPVALKFLPADVERDPDRLERFLTEVRMSLRVTHPNVCRVFDVGQIDERHFLSMEFVDGEDLASLLRRIGRLPEDKAIEIARQLCAGLSAAHDEGVLHRDLKPANIMIDGRGRAKIADFGLAGATDGIEGREARAGTPQYMAPEQVAGGALTERTDIYALGLVLYELFTGKRAFETAGLDDLERQGDRERRTTSTPTSPSSHVSGLNPLVERAILRCLDPDPAKRPLSAGTLAAALPGGDPLAMALAAGDTPSPEMVAAAGSDEGLRPAVAHGVLAVALVAMVGGALMAGRVSFNAAAAPTRPPAVMIERARELLRSVGFGPEIADSGWGFEQNTAYLNRPVADRARDGFERQVAHAQYFWYRESPVLLERRNFIQPYLLLTLFDFDPPMFYSGDVMVRLDREGRLRHLVAIPPEHDAGRPGPANWAALFTAAGLDISAWRTDTPQWAPRVYGDERVAWVPAAEAPEQPVRVEAASFHGRPTSFDLVYPWTVSVRDAGTERTSGRRAADLAAVLFLSGLMAAAVLVARRNLRLDRADRRGATRLALWMTACTALSWALAEHHVPSIWEMYLVMMGCGWALFAGLLTAAFYLALEPYVRRIWPSMIISWSRAMAGARRDPLVGRDLLIGSAVGAMTCAVFLAGFLANGAVTGVLPLLDVSPAPLLGARVLASALVMTVTWCVFLALLHLLLLVGMRQFLRREWAGIAGAALVMGALNALPTPSPVHALPFEFVANLAIFVLLARVGLVATIAAFAVAAVLPTYPVTWPLTAWYSGIGLIGLGVCGALAVIGHRLATAVAPRRAGVEAPRIVLAKGTHE